MELSTKTGDTSPLMRYQLIDVNGQPPNLNGATVVQRFAGAPEAGSPCEVDGNPTDGIVRLASRDHLPVPERTSARLSFETEVTYADGVTVQTFPTEGYDTWQIWRDLDHKAAD